jgi:hypothetical protein
MSDRGLELRSQQFKTDEDGNFAGGRRSAFLAVQKELVRRAQRDVESSRAFEKPSIGRAVESPTELHSAEIKSAQVEFFNLPGSFSSISAGGSENGVGGGGLPAGEEGDILYHGEEAWENLNAGHALAFNEYFVVINGALKKAKFLSTETPYDP